MSLEIVKSDGSTKKTGQEGDASSSPNITTDMDCSTVPEFLILQPILDQPSGWNRPITDGTNESTGRNSYGESPMSGSRHNNNKPKISILLEAPAAIIGATRAMEAGAAKYGRGNWAKGLAYTEIVDSTVRHLLAFVNREETDAETGLPHVDLALSNMLILSQFIHTKGGTDDRGTPE
jgi:hypothetical protein